MNSNRLRIGSMLVASLFCAIFVDAAERRVDPTFLHRDLTTAKERAADLTTATCHYKPLFGEGDPDRSILVGVARYGEAVVDPNGTCASIAYPEEDQVYVVLE